MAFESYSSINFYFCKHELVQLEQECCILSNEKRQINLSIKVKWIASVVVGNREEIVRGSTRPFAIYLWLSEKKTTALPNPNQNFAVESFLKQSVDELVQSELNLPNQMWRRVKLDLKKLRDVTVFWQKNCKISAKEREVQQNIPVKFELSEAGNIGITLPLTRECYNILE